MIVMLLRRNCAHPLISSETVSCAICRTLQRYDVPLLACNFFYFLDDMSYYFQILFYPMSLYRLFNVFLFWGDWGLSKIRSNAELSTSCLSSCWCFRCVLSVLSDVYFYRCSGCLVEKLSLIHI